MLVIVTGPPGAGKSTVAAALAQRWEPSVLVEGDAFFGFLRRGAIAPWLPEANEQNTVVTIAAGAATGRFATGGMVTIYDGVIGSWFLPDFARMTGLARLSYAVLLPPMATCLERVATRTGHGFTDLDAARHMYDQFASRTEGVDSRHYVRDPPDDVDAVADVIVSLVESGTIGWEAAG